MDVHLVICASKYPPSLMLFLTVPFTNASLIIPFLHLALDVSFTGQFFFFFSFFAYSAVYESLLARDQIPAAVMTYIL